MVGINTYGTPPPRWVFTELAILCSEYNPIGLLNCLVTTCTKTKLCKVRFGCKFCELLKIPTDTFFILRIKNRKFAVRLLNRFFGYEKRRKLYHYFIINSWGIMYMVTESQWLKIWIFENNSLNVKKFEVRAYTFIKIEFPESRIMNSVPHLLT